MINPDDWDRVMRLLTEFAGDVERFAEDRDAMRQFARQIVQWKNTRENGQAPAIVFEFMQFYLGTRNLMASIEERAWSDAGDWIVWSLSDQIEESQEREIEVGRIHAFLQDPTLLAWPAAEVTIIRWLWSFYYYARRRAAYGNVARGLWGLSNLVIESNARVSLDVDGATLAAMCLGWAAQEAPDLARPIAERVEDLTINDRVARRPRAMMGVSLATRAAPYTSRAAPEWAAYVLNDVPDALVGHERLQMLVGRLPAAYDIATKEDILREIARVNAVVPPEARWTIAGRRALDGISDLLLTTLSVAFHDGDVAFAIAAMARWYCITEDESLIGPTRCAVSIPFGDEGFSLQAGELRFLQPGDRQGPLVALTGAADTFAGTSNSVAGNAAGALHVPERFGVPIERHAAAFEAALVDAYFPASSAEAWQSILRANLAQLFMPPIPHPIQAIQRARFGLTLPWIASLQTPLSDRPIRRVVVWSGAASMTEEMETNAIRSLFEASGATVVSHSPETATLEDFVNTYQDDGVDVFWVSSHGEYDHWYPSDVAVQIARDGTFVKVDDLLGKAPESNARRLLVLNVCDGGRFEQTGALPRIGFGPALANRHQAVISHLWPVRGLVAGVVGALLASNLSRAPDYFAAFQEMLGQIRAPPDALATHLRAVLGEQATLAERVARGNEDFLSIGNYGSPVFFQ